MSCALVVRYDQCSAAQATLGNWADNPEWRDDLTVESPWCCHSCGFMITAKEDGMSESPTSGDMSVNCKPECQAAAKGDGIVQSNVDRK